MQLNFIGAHKFCKQECIPFTKMTVHIRCDRDLLLFTKLMCRNEMEGMKYQ